MKISREQLDDALINGGIGYNDLNGDPFELGGKIWEALKASSRKILTQREDEKLAAFHRDFMARRKERQDELDAKTMAQVAEFMEITPVRYEALKDIFSGYFFELRP